MATEVKPKALRRGIGAGLALVMCRGTGPMEQVCLQQICSDHMGALEKTPATLYQDAVLLCHDRRPVGYCGVLPSSRVNCSGKGSGSDLMMRTAQYGSLWVFSVLSVPSSFIQSVSQCAEGLSVSSLLASYRAEEGLSFS